MGQFKLSKSYVPKFLRGYRELKSIFSEAPSVQDEKGSSPDGWSVLPDPTLEVIGFGPHGYIYDSNTWKEDVE